MNMPIPRGWMVYIKNPEWHFGPFGMCYWNKRIIEIRPPKWIPKWFGLRRWWIDKTEQHELGHAWGIRGCKKPWCLMFEAKMWSKKWKDVWWEKVIAMVFQPFNGFDFCRSHKEFINERLHTEMV